jgi:hypothetical protein
MEKLEKYILDGWDKTVRRTDWEGAEFNEEGTLWLPYSFVVPCDNGIFKTMYYWDTYFASRGLLLSGRYETRFLVATPISLSRTLMSPESNVKSPAISLMSVVFPEPLGPRSPTIFPCGISKETPRKAGTLPYDFLTLTHDSSGIFCTPRALL